MSRPKTRLVASLFGAAVSFYILHGRNLSGGPMDIVFAALAAGFVLAAFIAASETIRGSQI